MNGWEVLSAGMMLIGYIWLGVAAFLCVWVTVEHIGSAMKARAKARAKAALAWREGYEQGVNDERLAAAVDIPEYRIPNRQNPYGKSESPTRQ